MTETKRRRRFLPYHFAADQLALTVEQCTIDGERIASALIDLERRVIDLATRRFSSVVLEIAIELDAGLIDATFPAPERAAPAARGGVTVTCDATRVRRAVTIVDGLVTAGIVRGRIELSRAELFGGVELAPFLCRRDERADVDDGFATRAGSRLASGAGFELRLDAATTHGDYLDIRYESFRSLGQPQFAYVDALYQLDCDGDAPLLWLNTDHARICSVFDGTGNTGEVARLRTLVFAQIAHAVWSRLFWSAARSVQRTDEADHAWEDAVLGQLLPAVYPDIADQESRRAALRNDLDQHGDDALMARLDGALQLRLDLAAAAESLARELA